MKLKVVLWFPSGGGLYSSRSIVKCAESLSRMTTAGTTATCNTVARGLAPAFYGLSVEFPMNLLDPALFVAHGWTSAGPDEFIKR